MTSRTDRIAEFKEVAELMPDDPVVRFGLAGAYLDAGLADDAVAEYRQAVRLKPDYSAAYRGLGRALEKAGRRSPDQEGDRSVPEEARAHVTAVALERLRARAFRRVPSLRVRSERAALGFVEDVGFCSTFY